MTKTYIRSCDTCGKEIKNMWEPGVTTLYRSIRIGRGHVFHDYQDNSIFNLVSEKKPEDFDQYGRGWSSEEHKEFNFCTPVCLVNFFNMLYRDIYKDSINKISKLKEDTVDVTLEELKKEQGASIPYFKKVQTMFSKDRFKEEALEQINELLKQLNKTKKELLEKRQ